ncbi:hypothetical protein [Undibacterium flavidum]|uniref:Peptidase A24A N-terminal domain-containing protein n=1 Tax=Undibacterium flavidum TaxID=2762297 RepID=A0ABR6YET6_9BURK|nr:hypothetical protein [Undibacterium flavidum]MBC3875085.1 hypothetical protein [Undibacterium flavidum]
MLINLAASPLPVPAASYFEKWILMNPITCPMCNANEVSRSSLVISSFGGIAACKGCKQPITVSLVCKNLVLIVSVLSIIIALSVGYDKNQTLHFERALLTLIALEGLIGIAVYLFAVPYRIKQISLLARVIPWIVFFFICLALYW